MVTESESAAVYAAFLDHLWPDRPIIIQPTTESITKGVRWANGRVHDLWPAMCASAGSPGRVVINTSRPTLEVLTDQELRACLTSAGTVNWAVYRARHPLGSITVLTDVTFDAAMGRALVGAETRTESGDPGVLCELVKLNGQWVFSQYVAVWGGVA